MSAFVVQLHSCSDPWRFPPCDFDLAIGDVGCPGSHGADATGGSEMRIPAVSCWLLGDLCSPIRDLCIHVSIYIYTWFVGLLHQDLEVTHIGTKGVKRHEPRRPPRGISLAIGVQAFPRGDKIITNNLRNTVGIPQIYHKHSRNHQKSSIKPPKRSSQTNVL